MIRIFSLFIAVLFVTGCNSSEEEATGNKVVRTEADSLYQVIDKGHAIGMAKMSPLDKAEERAKALLDSIQRLPAKAQVAAEPYKARLNTVLGEVTTAKKKMDDWMNGFDWDWDSNKKKAEEKVEYLKSEIPKVDEMKASILNSLEKADSLWRERF